MSARVVRTLLLIGAFGFLAPFGPRLAEGASFPGTARVSIADSTGGLSWNDTSGAQALTVACWFKLIIPSGATINENMLILANRNTGTWSGGQTGQLNENHAFAICLNASTRDVEFSTRGSGGIFSRALIEKPYLERWYHVAVVRSGTLINAYVDGRRVFNAGISVGNTQTTDGVSVGGLGTANSLRGEVIEVQIFQSALSQSQIAANRFVDLNPASWSTLKGYYKLAFSTTAANQLKNFAAVPPTGTDPATAAGTGLAFEETNREGEQSLFDSRKNDGRDSLAPLSGAFSWTHEIVERPTPGVPFEFTIGYNSGNAFNRVPLEDGFDPFAPTALGSGWRHAFEARVLPNSAFNPSSSSQSIGLMTWDGSIETWDFLDFIAPTSTTRFKTRHKEYRGELEFVGSSFDPNAVVRWITPDRLIYIFRSPFAVSTDAAMLGRLKEVQDFNGNRLIVEHYETGDKAGLVMRVTDTGGGVWNFNYNAQNLLTSVTGPSDAASAKWVTTFTYVVANGQNVLGTKSIAGPAGYAPVTSTQWEFRYNSQGLLDRIIDPRHVGSNTYNTLVGYDTYGRKLTQQDATGRTTQFEYNKPGLRQLTTTELHGSNAALNRAIVDTFDRKLRLLSRLDAMGFTTSDEYDDFGNVTATTDARGVRTTMTYDSRSNVLTRTNGLGETTTWEYAHILAGGTPHNKPTKEIRPATAEATVGWENRYEYDAAGNLRFHRDDLGTLAEHAYDARGLVVASKDANGNETRFTYDAVTGFLTSRTIAFGTVQAATWNISARTELGWPVTEVNPLNESTTFGYNINGQVVSTTDAIGRIFTKSFDANGNLTAESDGKGITTAYGYNDADERVSRTDRAGNVWTYGYTRFRELETTTAPAAISDGLLQQDTFTRAYDKNARLIKEIDPYGKFVSYEYDPNGNQTAVLNKLGQRWEKSYDALNRLIAERDPVGNVSRTSYDAAGRVLLMTNPEGNSSLHAYDGRGRLTRWTDPEGFAWIYQYDGVGNILDIEDANHGHYVMGYGPRNERLTERNQDNKTWTYSYDELVRLKTQTNPPGAGAGPGGGPVIRTFHYDQVGRVDYVQFNTGRTNTLGYDDNNNVRSIVRTQPGMSSTSIALDYDAMDRLVETRDTFSKTVRYEYDAISRVTKKRYPGAKDLTQQYDRLGRLKKLSFPNPVGGTHDCTFAYDDADRLTARTYPNGVTQTNSFDDAGRVAMLGYAGAATPPIALSYAYDRNGNKTGGTENGTLSWKKASMSDYNETSHFKADGKLVDRRDDAAAAGPRTFDYTYDDSGNMTMVSAPGESYALSYDEDNRTTAITWDVGLTAKQISNRYDALGRRISRTLDGVERRYVLDVTGDMERILCDTDGTGAVQAWYVHGPDLCFRVAADGTLTCYHADAMGNVVRTTTGAGALRNQYSFTPYGRSIPVAGSTPDTEDPYRFVGSQGVMLELPGLYFMRARYYSADAGLFLSADPLRNVGPGWQPATFLYAANNPLSHEDPNGLFAKKIGSLIKEASKSVVNGIKKSASAIKKVAASAANGGSSKVKTLRTTIAKAATHALKSAHSQLASEIQSAGKRFARDAVTSANRPASVRQIEHLSEKASGHATTKFLQGKLGDFLYDGGHSRGYQAASEAFSFVEKTTQIVGIFKDGATEIAGRGNSLSDVRSGYASWSQNIRFGIENPDAGMEALSEGVASITAFTINELSRGTTDFRGQDLQSFSKWYLDEIGEPFAQWSNEQFRR